MFCYLIGTDTATKNTILSQKTIEVVHALFQMNLKHPLDYLIGEKIEFLKRKKIVLFIANNYEHKGLDFFYVYEVLKTKEIYL